MKKIPESTLRKYTSLSSRIVWFCILGPLLLFFVLAEAFQYLEPRWNWLIEWRATLQYVIIHVWFPFMLLSLIFVLITPSLLFISLYPELGHAWMRGIKPDMFSTPWEQCLTASNF